MQYPDDFVARVTKAYPDSEQIKKALRNGDDSYLDRALCVEDGIPAHQIVEAFKDVKLDALYQKAQHLSVLKGLYTEFRELERQKDDGAQVSGGYRA